MNTFKCVCDNSKYTGSVCETVITPQSVKYLNDSQVYYDLFQQYNIQNCFNWNKTIKNFCSNIITDSLNYNRLDVKQVIVEGNIFVLLDIYKLCKNYCKNMEIKSECNDLHPNCNTWKSLGLCEKLRFQYPIYCKKSCNIC